MAVNLHKKSGKTTQLTTKSYRYETHETLITQFCLPCKMIAHPEQSVVMISKRITEETVGMYSNKEEDSHRKTEQLRRQAQYGH